MFERAAYGMTRFREAIVIAGFLPIDVLLLFADLDRVVAGSGSEKRLNLVKSTRTGVSGNKSQAPKMYMRSFFAFRPSCICFALKI